MGGSNSKQEPRSVNMDEQINQPAECAHSPTMDEKTPPTTTKQPMYYINDPDFPALSANSSSSAGHPRLAKAQGFTEHTDTEDLKAIDALVTTLRSHSRHCLRDFLNPKIRTFYFCSRLLFMSDFILTRNGTTVAIVTYPITPLGVGAVTGHEGKNKWMEITFNFTTDDTLSTWKVDSIMLDGEVVDKKREKALEEDFARAVYECKPWTGVVKELKAVVSDPIEQDWHQNH